MLDLNEEQLRENIAANIRARRKALGLSQRDLADKMRTQTQTISKYERGFRSPSIFTILQLIKALNCELDTFLFGSYEGSGHSGVI